MASFLFLLLLALSFSVLTQIGSNFANDLFDFKQGADTAQRIGPKRAVNSGLLSQREMGLATLAVLALAFFMGLQLMWFGGWVLLPIGIISILCAVWYTAGRYSMAYLGIGEFFVFLFFGLVAIMTTYFVHSGVWLEREFWLASAFGFLATTLLVLNNYRDIEADTRAGSVRLRCVLAVHLPSPYIKIVGLGPGSFGLFWRSSTVILYGQCYPFSLRPKLLS